MADLPEAALAIVPFSAEGPAAQLQALADERMQKERVVDFPGSSAVGQVRLRQLPGKALGAYAWNAGVELACFVEKSYGERLQGLRVLELGSGTGVTAIALAKLGARVIATDLLPDLVALCAENAALSGLPPGKCKALAFGWGEALRGELQGPFDLVIGSEITYNEGGFEPLLQTLCDLCREEPVPEVLLAETLRNKEQPRFWAACGEHFRAKEVAAWPQRDAWNVRDKGAPVRLLRLQARSVSPEVRQPWRCPVVQELEAAKAALRSAGACVLRGCGTAMEDAAALPAKLFGERLRAAPPPAEVSNRVLAGRGINKEQDFRAHTDGHAYGELFPDYFLLLCAKPCSCAQGANFLVDGYALLDDLAADPGKAWLPWALELTAVDQTSRLPSVNPVVMRAPDGRRALRCRLSGPPNAFAAQRVAKDSASPEKDAEMLRLYHEAVEAAANEAPRLTLAAGDALLVDNYRMFHGRDPFSDEDRLLWRVWIWTEGACGVPEGELCSTPGDQAGVVSLDRPGEGRSA